MASYKITIKNRSGATQNYVMFNETPKISDVVSDNVWLNVFQKKTVQNNGTAVFVISTDYSAVCGSADAKPKDGVSVTVGEPRKVTLGTADITGKLKNPGTSFLVEIKDGIPQFTNDPVESNGKINAFEIRTGPINRVEAVNSNWLIGLGSGDVDGNGLGGAAATFVPEGGKSYQIEPIKKYWISNASYSEGAMIKVSSVADKACAIDFSARTLRSATVLHDGNGGINLQADS